MSTIPKSESSPEWIPVSNPKANYLAHKEEIDEAIARVLESGRYILGEEVEAFEEEFARYIGVPYCIGVANGTDALTIALQAAGIGDGDEVITSALTPSATACAIANTGAAVRVVDVSIFDAQMEPSAFEAAITDRTSAVVLVHLYGAPCHIAKTLAIARRHRLLVVEDCAQAHGAAFSGRNVGSWGDLAAFSFYPTKNLGALGDGGAVLTSDWYYSQRAAQLRMYGWTTPHVSSGFGMNSRLDEVQAAVLRVKLQYLDAENHMRRTIAIRYRDAFVNLYTDGFLLESDLAESVCHQFVVTTVGRENFRAQLLSLGVQTLIHYPRPIHLQPGFSQSATQAILPRSEQLCSQVVSLPMYPELSDAQQYQVIQAVREVCADD